MVDPRERARLDGQAEALALLRNLQRLNWVRNQPRKSVELLNSVVGPLAAWPQPEREWRELSPQEWATGLLGIREWSAKRVDQAANDGRY